jgi:hypothetical protein
MAAAPEQSHGCKKDASVDNSVFILAGANMLNATDPTVGYGRACTQARLVARHGSSSEAETVK